ncbi:MAG: hypothetical protein DKM23_08715 [Candidatus Melainabacteria bacterium]|nr:MAG: hypothetical protein DKM23_08715 [Candidatus Melainabacteria bacterium]
MSRLIDGTSLFTAMNSGLTNTYSILSSQFTDGITLTNLANKDSTTALTSNGLNTNFKSYLQSNFNSIDKDHDGKISSNELQDLTTSLSRNGMTIEQLYQLGSSTGMSSSLLDTVVSHFNEIDKNKDGKVTNEEIQAYGVDSSVAKLRKNDRTQMLKSMSTFYDTSVSSDSSLLDYKYLSDSSSSSDD